MESPSHEEQLRNIRDFIKTSQERYEQKKREREDRFNRLQQQRQSILLDRAQILSGLNSAVSKAKHKIPLYEAKIRRVRDEKAVKKRLMAQPYRGELGIGSYEPWQLEDFYFVRDFVQMWVDEVLDYVMCQISSGSRGRFSASVSELQEELELEQTEMDYSKALEEVRDAVIDEVCNDLTSEAACVTLAIHYQAQQTVSNMILRRVLPEEGVDEKAVNLVSYTYIQLKKERSKHQQLWRHSQKMAYITDEGTEILETEENTFDGTILSSEGITPYNYLPDQMLTQNFKTYRESESQFWSGFSDPIFSILPLPKRYKGVHCTALSSDHSLLAVGTVQGDLAVWDLLINPPRVLKGCKRNSTVISIEWSLDSTQIVTLDQQGTIQIWSMMKGNSNVFEVKGYESIEGNLGFKPIELKCDIHLEPQDLLFKEGNLVSVNDVVVIKPTTVAFHPALSFLGHQESLMIGLANGNILKLNLGKSSSGKDVCNKIGKNIEAELFQAHKYPIQLISFVNNDAPMVTVDNQGFIHLWENEDESLSGCGWLTPIGSYKLDTTEKTYKPVEGSMEKVEFIDIVKGKGKIKELNRNDMIEKRKHTQAFINSLHLGRPWKTENVGNQKIRYLYAPRNVPESGTTFHSVTYYKDTRLLSQYTTVLYQPVKVACTKIMSCRVNLSGKKLVFLLLFGNIPPKTHHVRFVTLDVPSMKVSSNVVEIKLSEEEYKVCKETDSCGFDFSKVIDATGSEYIVTSICGVINGFSMTTGNLVIASKERDWIGCDLGKNQVAVFSSASVKVASQASVLCILFYAPKQSTVILLHLRDKNPRVVRQQVWQDFCRLINGKPEIPIQQTWRKKQWALDGEFAFHLECAMEGIVLDLVDAAIRKSEGIDDKSQSALHSSKNRLLPFVRHFLPETNPSN